MVPTLPQVTARRLATPRLETRVLTAGQPNGEPVLFIHGNLTSATWWEEIMTLLPARYMAIAHDQRGYGDADRGSLIDARRGLGDLADDATAVLDALEVEQVHIVGHSLGGSVAWRFFADHAERVLSVTVEAPGSPYGYGGTQGLSGEPVWPDFAGSGAICGRQEVADAIASGNATAAPGTFRAAMRASIVNPGLIADREDELVAASLLTHIGEDSYPGDRVASNNWPYSGPGVYGANNALSPAYTNDAAGIIGAAVKPPILWIRGAADVVVSNAAILDPGAWGPTERVPGYPGLDAYPPQPMVDQTRSVLDGYRDAGGTYREVVWDGIGHSPHIEDAARFAAALEDQL